MINKNKKLIKSKKLNLTQSQELNVLRNVVEIAHAELDLTVTLKDIVKVISNETKADSVFIYLFDDKHKHLVLSASKTPHKKELGKINLKSGEGIAGWVAKNNKFVAIEKNAYKDSRFKNIEVLPEDKFEAILSVPIIFKKKVIGVVNIQHKKPHVYSGTTSGLIFLIAKQISGVIVNARLYEDTKQKALQFDSLIKVSQSISSEDYLDEILNLIVVVTAEMLNSKICSIMILDDKGNELILKASQSLSLEYKRKYRIKVEGSLLGEVIKTKQPKVIYDVREEKKYKRRDLAIKEGLTSMLIVPMIVKEKTIGVINVYMKKPHTFEKEEVDVLQMVANQAAVAIENTHLVEEALKAKNALETRKIIERAKGILMEMKGLNEGSAHRLIHKKAMDSCRSMKAIAESILLMDELKG